MHVIGFSTEFYYYLEFGFDQIVNQYKWLEQDLKVRVRRIATIDPCFLKLQKANEPENRARQPWIVTMAHKPMYCSNNNDDECLYADGYIFVSVVFSIIESMVYDCYVDLIRRFVLAFRSFKPTA